MSRCSHPLQGWLNSAQGRAVPNGQGGDRRLALPLAQNLSRRGGLSLLGIPSVKIVSSKRRILRFDKLPAFGTGSKGKTGVSSLGSTGPEWYFQAVRSWDSFIGQVPERLQPTALGNGENALDPSMDSNAIFGHLKFTWMAQLFRAMHFYRRPFRDRDLIPQRFDPQI
jgi:hypothetical protein